MKPQAKIPKQYIVVLKQGVRDNAFRQTTDTVARELRGTVHYEYRAALKGFTARLTKKAAKALRKNPRVESGPGVGWSGGSSGGYEVIDGSLAHKGEYSAYFCNYNGCTEWIEQTVRVPTNGKLVYWWYQNISEGTATAYDFLRVQLFDSQGTLLATLRTRSNRHARSAWSKDKVGLAAFAGQTVRLRFTATTDNSLKSSFFVDDVKLK